MSFQSLADIIDHDTNLQALIQRAVGEVDVTQLSDDALRLLLQHIQAEIEVRREQLIQLKERTR